MVIFMSNAQLVEIATLECKKQNLKKSDLYEYCGVSHSFFSDLVKKDVSPSIDKVCKIADFLDVSIDYLVGRTDNPSSHHL